MFNQARLKLTTWYLLIIMFVAVSFSLVIHNMMMRQVRGFAAEQRIRVERRFGLPPMTADIEAELLNNANKQITLTLIIVDGVILLIAGGLGYFLAGKTLHPIKEMIDEQNRFISDSSHELRTPLTSLKSAIEVGLRDKQMTLKDAKAIISDNLHDVNRLQYLSDSLLRLTSQKNPSGQWKTKQDLKNIIAMAVKNISQIAKSREIILYNTVNKSASILGNADELSDLFTILIENAVKYSPKQSLVKISLEKDAKFVDVLITDSGIGISPKDLPHIFDRFFRSDKARINKGTGGFGLGLSIAKKIADDHRATITVQSKPGKGSTFQVRLPLSKIQPTFRKRL
jgi:signal transduction histidine kinase